MVGSLLALQVPCVLASLRILAQPEGEAAGALCRLSRRLVPRGAPAAGAPPLAPPPLVSTARKPPAQQVNAQRRVSICGGRYGGPLTDSRLVFWWRA